MGRAAHDAVPPGDTAAGIAGCAIVGAVAEAHSAAASRSDVTSRQLVLAGAVVLVVLQLALRGWALYPSWFYLDDFQLLANAQDDGLTGGYLLSEYDSQFMPLGRFMAWVVASQGLVNWPLAVTMTLGMQLLASLACLWMLVTLFGPRWQMLVPLCLYLFSAMTLPATMWWAASLNTLPLQLSFFLSVGTWVRYLRGRTWWLGGTVLAVVLGLLAYVKTVVLFPLLLFIAVAWFVEGGVSARLWSLLKRYWLGLTALATLAAAFAAYYLTQVPQLTSKSPAPVAGGLADTMLAEALMVGVVGGPWRWSRINPPAGLADPPDWSIHLAWVVVAMLAAYWHLRRRRTARIWVLFIGYALMSYVLLLTTRAPVVGSIAGLEYRYLTDVACALTLCCGLMIMPMAGTSQPASSRARPFLSVRADSRVTGVLVLALVISGVASSVGYARIWHQDNPGEEFLKNTQRYMSTAGAVEFADTAVPEKVLPGYLFPFNTTSRLLPVIADNAQFPEVSSRLAVLADDGTPRRAVIEPATSSEPGPVPGCGWRLKTGLVAIPMQVTAFDFTWWVRIGYLGSRDDTVTVGVGGSEFEAEVGRGLRNIFVNVTGEIPYVTLSGLEPGTTMCIDVVEVGLAVPGGPLEQ